MWNVDVNMDINAILTILMMVVRVLSNLTKKRTDVLVSLLLFSVSFLGFHCVLVAHSSTPFSIPPPRRTALDPSRCSLSLSSSFVLDRHRNALLYVRPKCPSFKAQINQFCFSLSI
ncbi:hypothetical protein FRC16_008028 [Serendipita sp. 398]|nr:hypothetical protein FRC16_008028 [Serendipita sp. 398]KAG8812362.1 hypothetical protein FRC18_002987 [Serendipita sp. 400]